MLLIEERQIRLSQSLNRGSFTMNVKKTGIVLATAAAAMFAAGTVASVSYAAGVKCIGANSCKGKGFTEAKDAAACTAAGGKVG